MTPFQLSRYLDYCSEVLSLAGKIAAVYIQRFDDSVVITAVIEVEDFTAGLSKKIWQKVLLLENQMDDICRPRGVSQFKVMIATRFGL